MNTFQQSLVDGLLHHEDAHERFAALIERTRRAPRLPVSERNSDSRVRGCASSVWLISSFHNRRCFFKSDADSPVVRGLVALLADYSSGSTSAEILSDPTDPLELLDLYRSLTPTRRHGLAAVSAAIREFARKQSADPSVDPA